MSKELPIIDLHTCVQGEGMYAGIPNILVRFSGCNLNCQFANGSICDTFYASWNPELNYKYSRADLSRIVEANPQIKSMFVTGGEPTIHEEALREVLSYFRGKGFFTVMETNGTKYIEGLLVNVVAISPKLSNSIPKKGTYIKETEEVVSSIRIERQKKGRFNETALKDIMTNYKYFFKFVISKKIDINEVYDYQKLLGIPSNKIYLMPEGHSQNYKPEHKQMVIELAIEYGYNYTDRLHIIAYDNQRIA